MPEDNTKEVVGEIQDRNGYRFDKPVSFFGARPVGQQSGVGAEEALVNLGLIAEHGSQNLFAGNFNNSLTSENLPTGWSISESGSVYTITHNLGTNNYVVIPGMNENNAKFATYFDTTSTAFKMRGFTDSGSSFASAMSFLVIKQN